MAAEFEHCDNEEFIDDVDRKVADLKEKENTRMCPSCGTRMEKQRRKCVNNNCGVALNAAERELSGEDILGTAIIEEPRKQMFQRKETMVAMSVDEEDRIHQTLHSRQFVEIEWSHVPSGHPSEAVRITVSDPIFENPSSYSAVAEVLRRVGHLCKVTRYGFTGNTSILWMSVTMDGLLYGLAVEVIKSTVFCPIRLKNDDISNVFFFGNPWKEHLQKAE